jgi:ligand-binding sensor domain-containing protein
MTVDADHVPCLQTPTRAVGRGRRSRAVGAAVLVLAALANTGVGTLPAAAARVSAAPGPGGPVAGTIFVANGGANAEGAGGTGPGSITIYPPHATGNVRAETVITKGVDGPGGLAVDTSGDLWVANEAGHIVEYSKADLTHASPAPTVTISYGAGGLAFDPSGDLWVINGTDVAELTKAEIAKSGAPKPVATLPDSCSVVFDSSGDLWEGSSGDSVAEFTKTQLSRLAKSATKSLSPAVTITSDSLNVPCKPAFDTTGDLWAGNFEGGTVVEFTKAQLTKSGSPTPKVTLSSLAIGAAGDVAIDHSGDLWVPNAGANAVVGFTKSQLAKSGSSPSTFDIAGEATGLNWPWAVATEP